MQEATGRLGRVRVLLQPNDPYIRFRGATRAAGVDLNPRTTYIAKQSGSGISLRTVRGRRVASSRGRLDGRCRRRAAGPAARPRDQLHLGRALPRRHRGAARGRRGHRGQPHRHRSLREGRRRGRDAELVAARGAQGAGGGRAHLRARHPADGSEPTTSTPTTSSQVYGGVSRESVPSNAAVDRTAGQILTHSGVPAVTYYFSTSGGHTENVEFSFIGALSKPWLVGVDDPYDWRSPYHRWQFSTTARPARRRTRGAGSVREVEGAEDGRLPASRARAGDRHGRVAGGHGSGRESRPRSPRHLVQACAGSQLPNRAALRPSRVLGPGGRAAVPWRAISCRARSAASSLSRGEPAPGTGVRSTR